MFSILSHPMSCLRGEAHLASVPPSNAKAYLIGGGIASLATAVYLIHHGKLKGENITLFEELSTTGGSLDGCFRHDLNAYVVRGGRMFNYEAYTATYDLLSLFPSVHDLSKTARDDMVEFKEFHPASKHHCRLVAAGGQKVDASHLGLNNTDRLNLVEILACSEDSLGNTPIDRHFQSTFFKTNFWAMWSTTFAFLPCHSAVELKRYLHRFIHEFPRLHTLGGVDRTRYNQYDSIILPLSTWLKQHNVNILLHCQVKDLEFVPRTLEQTVKVLAREYPIEQKWTVNKIVYTETAGGISTNKSIEVAELDLVFATIGSMTADSTIGSMTEPAKLLPLSESQSGSWKLWQNLAKRSSVFGKPDNFIHRIPQSKWLSFTATFHDSDAKFFRLMEKFTNNEAGSGVMTFKDSNWCLSIVLAKQPHFIDQNEMQVQVMWGYVLNMNASGNFVAKLPEECTGAELFIELCGHLGILETDDYKAIFPTVTLIPQMLPYITSQFLTRSKGDRPVVVPAGCTNLALLGQYVEITDDVVFTVEYSVRAAQIAVEKLCNLADANIHIVSPLYKGQHDVTVIYNALKTMMQ